MIKNNRTYIDILRHLASGDWPEGGRIPSLRELAEERQVSTKPCMVAIRTAASQGLLRMHPKSRAEVLSGAAELAKNILAGLAEQPQQRKVGVLIPEYIFGRPLEAEIRRTICRTAISGGLSCELVPIPQQGHMDFARKVAAEFDAAVAIDLPMKMLTVAFSLKERGFPILLFRRHIPGRDDIPSVTTDECGAARRLAQLLLGLGHRNVCMVSGIHEELMKGPQTATDGWMGLLREAGVIDNCALPVICYPGWTPMQAIQHVLSLRPRVTALVVAYPAMISWAEAEGYLDQLRVPEEISIAALDGAGDSNRPSSWPPLTHAKLNLNRAAEIVVNGLQAMLKGETPPPNIRLPMDIVITDSVAAPPVEAEMK